jgi:hypothetical protein
MINNILKHHLQADKYNSSSIYQMKCLGCPLKYVGQTGRMFVIDIKTIYMPSEITVVVLDIQIIY